MSEDAAELLAPVVQVEAPAVEPPVEAPVDELTPPTVQHPLQPGGKRFEQVYAQSKQAQRDLQDERDRRIRAEAQLELLGKPAQTAPAEKVYEWDELEPMIASGQITRADAYRHREAVLKKDLKTQLQTDFQRESGEAARMGALNKVFTDYMSAAPEIQNSTSQQRMRVDQEFDWLVSVQGKDATRLNPVERKALEVTALRNVLGPVETLNKRMSPTTETHQGSVGGQRPQGPANPDQKMLDDLSPRQIEHYNKIECFGSLG
jgi:hypothetical protein